MKETNSLSGYTDSPVEKTPATSDLSKGMHLLMAGMRQDFAEARERLVADMRKDTREIIRWMFVFAVAQVLTTSALLILLLRK